MQTSSCEASSSSSSLIIPLTKDNFQEVTAGKTVFIKWFAPWCGHCQAIKPIWEELATKLFVVEEENDDIKEEELSTTTNTNTTNTNNLILCEVDCTTTKQNEDWCIEMGITGFPTLTYGETSYNGIFLKEYNDHNDVVVVNVDDDDIDEKTKQQQLILQNLYNFANENLRIPYCSPGNIIACSPKSKQHQMHQYWNMSVEEIQMTIDNTEKQQEANETKYKQKYDEMQYQYNQLSKQYEMNIAKHKRQMKLYNSIINYQQQQQKQTAGTLEAEVLSSTT